jgi:hypothetical protein
VADNNLLQAIVNPSIRDIAKVVYAYPNRVVNSHGNINIQEQKDVNRYGCCCPPAFNPDSENVLYHHHTLICELHMNAISVPFNGKFV